jgi:rubrerythrin
MGRIKIERIKISGEYEFDQAFEDGLHILTGTDNSCGKSLFIKLIDFALGDDGGKLNDYNILKKCTFFYAQLKIDNDIITIRRNINKIDSTIDFFKNKTISEVLNNKESYEPYNRVDYQKFIFKKITKYDYIKTIAPLSGKSKTLSLAYLSNLFYLNQGVEAGQLFRYPNTFFPNYLKEKVFSLYLDTKKIRKSMPEVEIFELKDNYSSSLSKLNIIRQFFSENVSNNNYFGELEKTERYGLEIQKLKDKEKRLDSEIISLDLFTREDKEKLTLLNREILELREEVSGLKFFIKENAKLVNDYREDIEKTEKNITAFNIFSKFNLCLCPECGKKLELDKIDIECPLCKEEYDIKKETGGYIEKNMSYLSYLKDSLKDCIEVLDNKEKDMEQRKSRKESLIFQAQELEKRLRKKLDSTKNPAIEEKLKLKSEISQKRQQLIEMESNLKILLGFRREDERLEKLKKNITNLERDIENIEQDRDDKEKEDLLMEVFRKNFNSFFNNTIYPYFERGYVENDFTIETTTSKDGTKKLSKITSESDKVVVRLGLFYSIFKTAIEKPEVNHPRLLYLDSPRDQELKWNRFCEALSKYKKVVDNNPGGQIFITVVVDGGNKFSEEYESLDEHVFMNLTNREGEMLLKKKDHSKQTAPHVPIPSNPSSSPSPNYPDKLPITHSTTSPQQQLA